MRYRGMTRLAYIFQRAINRNDLSRLRIHCLLDDIEQFIDLTRKVNSYQSEVTHLLLAL